MEPEIIVQDPPKSPERERAMPETINMERKNFCAIAEIPEEENPLADAESYLVDALHELQKLYDKAFKANAATITIERTMFTTIATTIQKAWERVQVGYTHKENIMLSSVKQIQASIASLEQKYEDIQTKVTEAPKTYTEIIKSISSKESKVE